MSVSSEDKKKILVIKQGVVEKKSGECTVKVCVSTRKPHPLYKKVMNYSKRYLVHDPKNEAVVGDKVKIVLSRPISARKRWRLHSILSKEG